MKIVTVTCTLPHVDYHRWPVWAQMYCIRMAQTVCLAIKLYLAVALPSDQLAQTGLCKQVQDPSRSRSIHLPWL